MFPSENSSPFGLCELGSHCLYELNVDTRDVSVIGGKLDDYGTDDGPVPSGLASRGEVLYIAEHPLNQQGAVRLCIHCQGLKTSRLFGMGYLVQWEWFPKCLPLKIRMKLF